MLNVFKRIFIISSVNKPTHPPLKKAIKIFFSGFSFLTMLLTKSSYSWLYTMNKQKSKLENKEKLIIFYCKNH